jgi:hypothetical protein
LGFGHSIETYEGGSAGGRLVRHSARPGVLRRIDVQPGKRCLQGGLARLVEECRARDIQAHRLPGGQRAPRPPWAPARSRAASLWHLLKRHARRNPAAAGRRRRVNCISRVLYAQCARFPAYHKDACQKKRLFNSRVRSSRPCPIRRFASNSRPAMWSPRIFQARCAKTTSVFDRRPGHGRNDPLRPDQGPHRLPRPLTPAPPRADDSSSFNPFARSARTTDPIVSPPVQGAP